MLNFIRKIFSLLNSRLADRKITYINVPYSEKDKAKKFGAKWDSTKKSWFIPKGLSHVNFEKWIQKDADENFNGNIRSTGFFIAESSESCWKCKQDSPVFAFLLPENHQTKEYEDEDDTKNNNIIWQTANYKSIVNYTSSLHKRCVDIIKKLSPHYYDDFSVQASGRYYMNHCKNCNSKLGDFYMHSEPGGAFQPITNEAAKNIKLYWFNDKFEASVGAYSIDVNHFDHMQIISP